MPTTYRYVYIYNDILNNTYTCFFIIYLPLTNWSSRIFFLCYKFEMKFYIMKNWHFQLSSALLTALSSMSFCEIPETIWLLIIFSRRVYMIVQIICLQVNIGSEGISNFSLFISRLFFFRGGGCIWCYNLRWLKIILCSF